MPDSPIDTVQPAHRLGHWAAVAGLVAALLLVGFFQEQLVTFFTSIWLRLLAATGLLSRATGMQQGISGGIVKRLLPAVVTYAVLYLGVCLLLLRLLLTSAQWRVAALLYAGTLAVYVAITLLGKLAGDAPWAYRLSRQILDFVVSPLPIAGLYVLFRAGFGPQPHQPPQT